MSSKREFKRRLKKKRLKALLSITAALVLTSVMKLTGFTTPVDALNNLGGYIETIFTRNENENENENKYDNLTSSIVSNNIANFANSNSNLSGNNAQIASGANFGVVLKSDGTVWTWGNNQYGQLGNGNIENVNIYEPARVVNVNGEGLLENIQQITVGSNTAYALTDEGKVVGWGLNTNGQIGNNAIINTGVPAYVQKQVQVTDEEGTSVTEYRDLDNIVSIAAGANHALAIADDGTVWAWGLNNYGELGINVGNTTATNVNGRRIYAVKVQKQVQVTDEEGTITNVLVDLDNIEQVTAGIDFSVAVTKDGEVYAWGLGTSGQIGNNASATVYIPTKVAFEETVKIKQIDAGGYHVLAIDEDGNAWAWGINRYGNLGRNTANTATNNAAYKSQVPVQVLKDASTNLTDVVSVSAILDTSFAITSDGKVYGWGLNTSGQIGDYTVTNKLVATLVKTDAITTIKGIKTLADGQNTNTNYMIDEKGYIYGSGVASSYQLMSNRTAATFFAVKFDESYLKINNNQEYLEVGKTLNLDIDYYNGFNVNNYEEKVGTLTYRSSNTDIADVDNTGKVTAKKNGIVTIIAEDKTKGHIAEAIITVVSKDATALPMVVTGTTFTAYLKEDGTVWTSGASGSGELGNGSNIAINTPTQVKINTNEYLTGIRKIAVGTQHAIALKNDGTVWTWGLNSSGQLGINSTTISRYAVQVKDPTGNDYLRNIIDIDTGVDNSSALAKDGKVYAWGDAGNNGLGINSTTAQKLPVLVHGASNGIQVQSGNNNVIILKGDGTVWGAGQNNVGQLADNGLVTPRAEIVPAINSNMDGILTGIVRISAGNHHTIALKEDKTAIVWGYNNTYQLGNNGTTNYSHPINLPGPANVDTMTGIYDIATGPQTTYVITGEGEVYAVGLNTGGELSVGNATTQKVFIHAVNENGDPLTGVVSINKSLGTSFGFAMEDGTVGVTGLGTSGQHGNATWTTTNKITKVNNASIFVGDQYEIDVDGTAKINIEVKQGFNLNIDNKLEISVDNLTYTSLNEEIAQVLPDGTIKGIKEGTTGITIEDEVTGLKTTAQVIVGDREFKDIYKIVAGENHTVLLKEDGTVWAWGDNTYGQLGNGTIGGKEVEYPVQVLGINGKGYLEDVVDIAAGQYFTIALMKNGRVASWGRNDVGQLGNTNDIAENPINVIDYNGNILTGVVDIGATRYSTAVVKADGTVWTWGSNDNYQLGNNTTTNSSFAVQVLADANGNYLTGVKEVNVGGAFVVALKEDGTVWAWGLGTSGQLGNNAKTTQKFPVQATGVEDVKKIVTGHHYTLVLKNDGTVWAWGLNNYGQLGYGSSSTDSKNANYAKAIQTKVINIEDVVDIGANVYTSYAITSDGIVWAWGYNTEGAIGDNTTGNKATPTKIVRRYTQELEKDVIKLMDNSAHGYTNYMIKKDGSILANGRSKDGQLLDGGKYANRAYAEDVLPSYLEITEKNVYIKLNSTKKLEAKVVENVNAFAEAPEYGTLKWKSTNENVATVSQDGTIQAKGLGSTTIIVEEDKFGYRAQATIYVTENNAGVITAPMVVQGTSFTVVLKADGTVWTTGLNTSGQLGDGTTTYRAELKRVKTGENDYLKDIVRISAGTSHVLAVTKDGEVYAWGLNSSGQLGDGTTVTTAVTYAQKVLDSTREKPLTDIIDIAAGAAHSIALDSHGNVYAWGAGANYKLGNYATGNLTLPTRIADAFNIVKISAGTEFTVLLRGDGVALGTGLNTNGWLAFEGTGTACTPLEMGSTTNKEIYKNIYDIATGGNHTILLKEDGKAYAIGLGTSGQLAQNAVSNISTIPVALKILNSEEVAEDLENIVSISAGNATTFVITKDGKTYSSGLNTSGQLALGNNTSTVATMKEVLDLSGENGLKDVVVLSKGVSNTINSAFILKDGTVWTVGTGTNGQLGNGEYLNHYNVVRMGEDILKVKDSIIHMQVDDTLEMPEITLIEGINVYNNDKKLGSLKYESLNTNVVTVNETTGLITAKGIGTAKIKITDKDNDLVTYVQVIVSNSMGAAQAKIASGYNFSVALKEDGTVWTWGNGSNGKLGNGDTANKTEPVQVLAPVQDQEEGEELEEKVVKYLTGVVDIAAGYDSSSALLSDGTIVSWGAGANYSLGNGTSTADSSIPVYVLDSNGEKLSNIVKIARGNDHNLALTAEGEIYSWGYNNRGQLGLNNSSTTAAPTKVKDETGYGTLKGIVDIACGMYTSYALTETGEVWAWGYNNNGQLGNNSTSTGVIGVPKKVSNLTDVVKIGSTSYSAIALTADGKVWTWGLGSSGQLGNNASTGNILIPVQARYNETEFVENAIDIGTAATTAYILTDDYKVYATGLSAGVGDNTTTNRFVFTEVKAKYGGTLEGKFVALSKSGIDNAVAYFTRDDGSVFGVGANTNYQLFGKMTTNLNAAKEMNISYMEISDRVDYIKVGDTKTLTTNMVENFNMHAKKPVTGKVTWFSSNAQIASIDESGTLKALKEGQTTITAVDDKYGYIAIATIYVTRNEENVVAMPQVAQSENTTIVLRADGTVWATGRNNVGQLGIGTTTDISKLQQVMIDEETPLENIVKISSGLNHALALTKDGKVYGWGLNTSGQLGINSKNNSLYAAPMLDSLGEEVIDNVIDISAGREFSVILTKNGYVYTTGSNAYGQLGNATNTTYQLLVKMEEVENVVQIGAGQYHTVILKGDGTVWTVGYNYYGQLGINSTTRGSNAAGQGVNIARQVMNESKDGVLKNIIQISTGGWHIAALNKDKEVFTWGYGKDGQIGNNAVIENNMTPVKVLDPTELVATEGSTPTKEVIGKVAKIGTSERVTFLVTEDDKVYATGENSNYQLAQNNNTDLTTIKQLYYQESEDFINNILNVPSSSANTNNTALIRRDGTVWVSGIGTYGQVGNNETQTVQIYTRMGVAGLSIDKDVIGLAEGETKQLDVEVTEGFNVYDVEIELQYKSLDTSIVDISSTGLITGKKLGRTQIEVTNVSNGTSTYIDVCVAIRMESIVQGMRDVEFDDGDYDIVVEDNVYRIELINYHENKVYSLAEGETERVEELGDEEIEYKTLVVKYYGDLTIEKGVTLTARAIDNLTYKKGMYLCVLGNIYNEGTISMTARGTYNAKGQDVYLWRNTDDSFEYVPAVGGEGGASVKYSWSGTNSSDYSAPGIAGENGENRATGGGGSGALYARRADYSSGTRTTGAGSAGTSWSGGTGGGGIDTNYGGTYSAGNGATNGGAGGNGWSYRGSTGWAARSAGGGAGNTGGIGQLTPGGKTAGAANASYYGKNGTGGLLIIYTNDLYNKGTISSNGSNGGGGTSGGGSSGGGSINIFANNISIYGKTTTTGGTIVNRSGAGGTGSTTLTILKPDLNYPEKSIRLNIGATYSLDKSKLTYLNQNEMQTGLISVGNIKYEILDESIATVGNDGKITAIKEGQTKVKITDETSKITTYIYLEVIDNSKVDVQEGKNFTVALKQNGTVWSYGLNDKGQLGIGNNENKNEPVQVEKLSNVKEIATGYSHALALTKSGEVYSWGLGANGQLGNGGEEDSNVPIKVNGVSNIVKIDAYKNISLALDNEGKVYIWGEGQSVLPMRIVFSETVIDISGTLMLTEKGEVYDISDTMAPLERISNIAKISSGESHYLALTVDGKLLVWGTNTYGEIGNGSISEIDYLTDMDKLIGEIYDISAGNGISILRNAEGKFYVLGNNANGQIGLETTTKTSIPIEIQLEDIEIEDISAGEGTHSSIITRDGFVWNTGLNIYGELGTGDNIAKNTYSQIGETIIVTNYEKIFLDIQESQTITARIENTFNLKVDLIDDNQDNFNVVLSEEGKISLDGKIVTGLDYGSAIATVTHKDYPSIKKDVRVVVAMKMESIVQGFRDIDLDDGVYSVVVNNEEYTVELINHHENMVYEESEELGDDLTEHKTLVVKYYGDLTIKEGVTLTAKTVDNLTYKKGMYLCVLGNIYNEGTISMTARGTYNAEGQDVYLWKNIDGSYEYVAKDGGTGGASVSYSWSSKNSTDYNAAGKAGENGEGRATGGGGSGALTARRANYASGVRRSGAGSA